MESGVLLGGDTQLVVEGVMPDLLHVVPVGHNAVLNGVLQGEDTWENLTKARIFQWMIEIAQGKNRLL